MAAKGMSWKDGAFVPAKGVEVRQGAEPAVRGSDRDIPPEVKWLADVLGLDPHFVMRNPTSYMRRTGGPAPMDGDLDPDRFD